MKKPFRIPTTLAVLVFIFSIFFIDISKTEAACVINSAKFEPSGLQDINWYKEVQRPFVKIHITSTGCAGQTIELSVTERDSGINDDVSMFDNKPFAIPPDGNLTILARAGEDKCEPTTNNGTYDVADSDCHYFIEIFGPAEFESLNQAEGELYYECDKTQTESSACDDNWVKKDDNTDGVLVEGSSNITNQQLTNNTYKFLAPLLGLSEVTGNEGVATFLEKVFIIMISLAGVLAVLSLIFAGFQYITTGVFSVKTDAKDRIWNSILGLLLALGAFVILNTINPDLVNNLGLNIETVKLSTVDTPQKPNTDGSYAGTTAKIGDAWPDDQVTRDILAGNNPSIKVKLPKCTIVGQHGCTSVYQLDTQFVTALKYACAASNPNCDITITGGTEFWGHAANTAGVHYPNGWTVDIRKTPSLTTYVHTLTKTHLPSWIAGVGADCYSTSGGLSLVEEGDHFHALHLTSGCSLTNQGQP